MSKDMAFELYVNNKIRENIFPSDMKDQDTHHKAILNIYAAIFEIVIQSLNRNGFSLEDMVKQIGDKAKRHSHHTDYRLGRCIDKMFEHYKALNDQYAIEMQTELRKLHNHPEFSLNTSK